MDFCMEAERKVPVSGEYDVIVCGAGPAGVCAAIAAGRSGAKTCLIELKGCLGGTWTAGLLAWIIDHGNKDGIIAELIGELCAMSGREYNRDKSMPFDVEDMKYLLESKCIEAGVDIRLHTAISAAVKKDDATLDCVITESKSGREAWRAQVFIDATGDGDLGARAGCRFAVGNPDTGLTQPMSLLCLMTGIKLEDIKDVTSGYCAGWLEGKLALVAEMNRGGVDPSYGFPTIFHLVDDIFLMMANHQYKVSGLSTDDVTRATLAARKEIRGQIQALRSLGGRWKNLRLIATGEQVGVREGRRLKGLYELTLEDMIAGAEFDDAVCKCRFGVDVHATDPAKDKGIESSGKYQVKPYDIPLRSLISADVGNLMMAGRCISGDFFAHSSYRVTGDAAAMGEAAGHVAALATRERISPAAVKFNK